MKITHVKSKPSKPINVVKAAYVDGYRLNITFDDGTVQLVDFEPFLRYAHNPMTTKYLDLRKFKTFNIDWGNLSWNDREMIFPIIDLYRGKIELFFPETVTPNGHIRKTESLPIPTLTLRRFRAHAKKAAIPPELLAEQYLEEGMKRHAKIRNPN